MTADDRPGDPLPENEFLIQRGLYFLAPFPRPPADQMVSRLLRMGFTREDGTHGEFVPAFTDLDLSTRFLARAGAGGAGFKPIYLEGRESLLGLFHELFLAGETHIGFDPEPSHVRRIPIPRIVDGLRNRPR